MRSPSSVAGRSRSGAAQVWCTASRRKSLRPRPAADKVDIAGASEEKGCVRLLENVMESMKLNTTAGIPGFDSIRTHDSPTPSDQCSASVLTAASHGSSCQSGACRDRMWNHGAQRSSSSHNKHTGSSPRTTVSEEDSSRRSLRPRHPTKPKPSKLPLSIDADGVSSTSGNLVAENTTAGLKATTKKACVNALKVGFRASNDGAALRNRCSKGKENHAGVTKVADAKEVYDMVEVDLKRRKLDRTVATPRRSISKKTSTLSTSSDSTGSRRKRRSCATASHGTKLSQGYSLHGRHSLDDDSVSLNAPLLAYYTNSDYKPPVARKLATIDELSSPEESCHSGERDLSAGGCGKLASSSSVTALKSSDCEFRFCTFEMTSQKRSQRHSSAVKVSKRRLLSISAKRKRFNDRRLRKVLRELDNSLSSCSVSRLSVNQEQYVNQKGSSCSQSSMEVESHEENAGINGESGADGVDNSLPDGTSGGVNKKMADGDYASNEGPIELRSYMQEPFSPVLDVRNSSNENIGAAVSQCSPVALNSSTHNTSNHDWSLRLSSSDSLPSLASDRSLSLGGVGTTLPDAATNDSQLRNSCGNEVMMSATSPQCSWSWQTLGDLNDSDLTSDGKVDLNQAVIFTP